MPSKDPDVVDDSVLAVDDFDGIPVTVVGRLSLMSRLASSYGMYAVLYVEEDDSPVPRIRYTGCIKSEAVDLSLLVLMNEQREFDLGTRAAHMVLEAYWQKGLPFGFALTGPLVGMGNNPSGSEEDGQ